ncbi:MAG TPA: HEPN domain-containing protein [Chloroflexi bacterium]|nr:HEPN domain-containing protein [Chloroflexota bacterium]
MLESEEVTRQEVRVYMERSHEMLDVAALNWTEGYYGSAINRAYYAIFYAANALPATRGLARSKHSGVIAAFRRRFVKTGRIEVEYSRTYERVMDDRQVSDYDVEAFIDPSRAGADTEDARRFVQRIERFLREEGWL